MLSTSEGQRCCEAGTPGPPQHPPFAERFAHRTKPVPPVPQLFLVGDAKLALQISFHPPQTEQGHVARAVLTVADDGCPGTRHKVSELSQPVVR
ncbi:hypothetical protein HRbin36_02769 [bacterium HR36]|nr:hypothetical protein HRbin36_02769 [bacterium HR36]